MYMSKAKRDTLADMVLAHRVAVRNDARAESGTDEYWTAFTAMNITQYALDVALGQPDSGWKVETLRDYWHSDRNEDAFVALIRLEKLGVIEHV